MKINIDDIKIGERHRRDMGDIHALAKSIREQGLLQSVGILEDYSLVFGARRIEACKLLGWTEIETRIVNVTSIVEGEYAENEVRKEFTKSERVAIAAAVEEELGKRERRGNPDFKSDSPIQEIVPELPRGQQTRDFVAERSGLGSGRTYEQAKRVIENGTPELIRAMDEGNISVKNAETIARLPPDDQREALGKPKPELISLAVSLRASKPLGSTDTEKRTETARDISNTIPIVMTGSTETKTLVVSTQAERFATIALSQLERITADDPYGRQALLRVRRWVNIRLKEGFNK